jgi:hypothetical protein
MTSIINQTTSVEHSLPGQSSSVEPKRISNLISNEHGSQNITRANEKSTSKTQTVRYVSVVSVLIKTEISIH